MKLNTTPRINGDPALMRELREHAVQVNALAEGKLVGTYNASTASPTTGTYAQGDFILNTVPADSGTTGNKYTIHGWVCVVGGTPGTWVQARYMTGDVTPPSTQRIVACVLRNTGSGWFAIDDADHTPIGVSSVSTSSTAITVNYNFTATTIHTNIVTVDDTFATTPTQYLVGASSGMSSMVIYLGIAGTPGVVNPTTVVSSTGNLWVYGLFDEA